MRGSKRALRSGLGRDQNVADQCRVVLPQAKRQGVWRLRDEGEGVVRVVAAPLFDAVLCHGVLGYL